MPPRMPPSPPLFLGCTSSKLRVGKFFNENARSLQQAAEPSPLHNGGAVAAILILLAVQLRLLLGRLHLLSLLQCEHLPLARERRLRLPELRHAEPKPRPRIDRISILVDGGLKREPSLLIPFELSEHSAEVVLR